MARKKVSTTIYLEQEQLDALQALSKETKVPMAEYIRQGVDHVLTTHARELAVATLHAAAEAAVGLSASDELTSALQVHHLAERGHLLVDAPQVVVGELVLRRCLERRDPNALGVARAEHVADRAVLAAGIQRLQHHQQIEVD